MHVTVPAVTAPMSTTVRCVVPEWVIAPVHSTEADASATSASAGVENESRTREPEFWNASPVAGAGVALTCAVTPTDDWSARTRAHVHCPAATVTVCPAVPPAVDAPDRHENEPAPPVIVMDPEPTDSGADTPADERDSAITDWPQSPAWSPLIDRARHVHSPGAASISSSVGTEPVRTRVVPLEAHSSSHAVADRWVMPTCTFTVPAVVGGRGMTRGAVGETIPSEVISLINILSVSPLTERVWMLAPSANAAATAQVVVPVVHLVVPVASRTVFWPEGRRNSHRAVVPAAIPGECPGFVQATAPDVRLEMTGRAGGLMLQNAE